MAAPTDRLQVLERIEGDIAGVLQTAANVLQELAKDKASIKQVENHSAQFLKALNGVETELTRQISYLTQVSTGQPHEGSSYASGKVLHMAWHRLQHARNEAAKLDGKRGHAARQGPLQAPPPPPPPPPYQAPPGALQQAGSQPPPGYGQQPAAQ
ncbi:mediator of RNA polymerase II transcription subunit 11-like [Pollicipes pollicipes]|uniref:mediator of RNA polymerase II transcription subunit 11-like n=1 Tax=Pollicipes pollicipes TaxID=41117 RepID=UPI001884E408|nr:mediator of RNA polymerase II transcription subunit 11-like [Pollicipes pollicipes]XP_037075068.1 mediator of RNA polymerase II transcription subunit 11-like [Pollicipes pollicipes]